ncbi:MAG: potassium channel family protein [Myxococcaceae bacterium]
MSKPQGHAFSHVRRYPEYVRMLARAFSTPLVGFVVIAGNLLWVVVSISFFRVESGLNPAVHDLADALWWGLSTLTTVGFGDIVPVTGEGRLLAVVLMLSGNFFFVSFSGLLFSILLAQAEKDLLLGQRVTWAEHHALLQEVRALRQEIAGQRRA